MLQEAWTRSSTTGGAARAAWRQQPPAQSLSDTLKGKQGRFRQNRSASASTYSGRSVVVVGPS